MATQLERESYPGTLRVSWNLLTFGIPGWLAIPCGDTAILRVSAEATAADGKPAKPITGSRCLFSGACSAGLLARDHWARR